MSEKKKVLRDLENRKIIFNLNTEWDYGKNNKINLTRCLTEKFVIFFEGHLKILWLRLVLNVGIRDLFCWSSNLMEIFIFKFQSIGRKIH